MIHMISQNIQATSSRSRRYKSPTCFDPAIAKALSPHHAFSTRLSNGARQCTWVRAPVCLPHNRRRQEKDGTLGTPPILRFISRRSWDSPRHEACASSDISSVKRFVGKPTSQNLRRKNQQVERLQEMKRKHAFIQQGLKFPQPLIDRQSQYRNLQNTCKQDGPGFFELHG